MLRADGVGRDRRPASSWPTTSYLQFFQMQDAGAIVSVQDALDTPGALLFTFDPPPVRGGGRPPKAHVAISLGDGRTIEAMSTKHGIKVADENPGRWTNAAIIPEFAGQRVDMADVMTWVGRDDDAATMLYGTPMDPTPYDDGAPRSRRCAGAAAAAAGAPATRPEGRSDRRREGQRGRRRHRQRHAARPLRDQVRPRSRRSGHRRRRDHRRLRAHRARHRRRSRGQRLRRHRRRLGAVATGSTRRRPTTPTSTSRWRRRTTSRSTPTVTASPTGARSWRAPTSTTPTPTATAASTVTS